MPSQIVHITSLNDYSPEIHNGVELISHYRALVDYLKQQISEEAANFISEPSVDNNSKTINWIVSREGPVVDYRQLYGNEQNNVTSFLHRMAERFSTLGETLKSSSLESERQIGILISRLPVYMVGVVTGHSDEAKVYVVGGTPVLAGWGIVNVPKIKPKPAIPESVQPIEPIPQLVPKYIQKTSFLDVLKTIFVTLLTLFLILFLLFFFVPGMFELKDTVRAPRLALDDIYRQERSLQEELENLRDQYENLLLACQLPPDPIPPEPDPIPPEPPDHLLIPSGLTE
ncbi:MAG: hypothetical protein LBF22_15645, partial [Deltaproteobacteria bacterium]|nr:hypothetical protein [Deltaproteobacteria bacterium]